MRVIAGRFRGRPLAAPKGSGTRPTTDRVREALMSSIASARGGFDGACVLDAFAGTGALGIEALSRGARYALAFERDRAALAALRQNGAIPDPGTWRLVARDVTQARSFAAPAPFDLLFFDPPYAFDAAVSAGVVAAVSDAGLLAQEALLVYEHAPFADEAQAEHARGLFAAHGFELLSEKRFGAARIDLYRKDPE